MKFFLEQQRIPTKVCKKKARDAERNVILYVGRLKTPLSLNIQYNLPKFPRIEYSFTTGSQLHLDFHSIFKYFLPTPPQIVGPQEPPLVLPQRPKHQLSSHRAHRGPCRRRHDSPALALLFLQVGCSFYSFYTRLIESKLSALCTNCVSFNLKSVLFLKRVEELCGKMLIHVVCYSIYNVLSLKLQSSYRANNLSIKGKGGSSSSYCFFF